jgi:hypothetical protein
LECDQGLELADDFAAGAFGVEHLPEERPEGALLGVGAIAAILLGGSFWEEAGGQAGVEAVLQLSQGASLESFDGVSQAGAAGGQAGSPDREEGSVVIHNGRYIYRPIDTSARLFFMKVQKPLPLVQYQQAYARLRDQLVHTGWISEGYVQDRGPGAGGPCYQWTRKVKGKTVSVALSKEQFEWLRDAILTWRQMQQTIKRMQRLSREVLFATVPHPPRRKRLGKKVLGTK